MGIINAGRKFLTTYPLVRDALEAMALSVYWRLAGKCRGQLNRHFHQRAGALDEDE